MSPAALKLVGAELDQFGAAPEAVEATYSASDAQREAQRMAELAAAFSLFGLRIDPLAEFDWQQAADAAYRAELGPHAAPANDAAPVRIKTPGFAEFPRRGAHIQPTAAIQLIQAIDWVLVLAAAEFAALWGAGASLTQLPLGATLVFLISATALKAGLWLTEAYRTTPARIRPEHGIGGLTLGAILGLVIANLFAPDARAAAALAAIIPVSAMVLAVIHAALAVWINAAHRKGLFAETVVVIGATPAAERLVKRAERTGEARVVAIVDDRLSRAPAQIGAIHVGGSIDDLLAWQGLPHVDRIVITVTQKAEARVHAIIERLRLIPNRVDLLLDYETQNVRGARVQRFGGAAVACVSGSPHSGRRAFVKRAQDLILGSLLLAFFTPAMAVIALAVKLDSKGPALYRQRRHGFNNRVITVLKFRTMRHEPDAPLRQVCSDDPRVTRLGKFLRITSLDELPQLINVLRGDMSLVGPRPHAIGMKAAERDLEHIVAEYAHRHRVKPGLTGWAQINGSRGPIETPAAVRRRLKFDLEYVAQASLWLDLQILLRTAPALLGDRMAIR
ncbi:MAG: exopolysaccharide biosynthesis polyprenyl glycosylphosphotransferase [Hyphomonadaceae bacterium]